MTGVLLPMSRPWLRAAALGATLFLAACAGGANLGGERAELGDFRLSHNVVVAENAQTGPFSRQATAEEWEEALRNEVARRLGRYEGTRLYHIGINVDAYVLAMPGVPVVAAPRSALIVTVNIWDDALGRKLNDTPRQFTVLEDLSGATIVSSGFQRREDQMRNLVQNAVVMIEGWLAENPQWFNTGAAQAALQEEGAEAPDPEILVDG